METKRWDEGLGANSFYESADAARQAVLQLHKEISVDPEATCEPMHIEKIEFFPLNRERLVKLLNEGIQTIIRNQTIIETVRLTDASPNKKRKTDAS